MAVGHDGQPPEPSKPTGSGRIKVMAPLGMGRQSQERNMVMIGRARADRAATA